MFFPLKKKKQFGQSSGVDLSFLKNTLVIAKLIGDKLVKTSFLK
jgi:hypothetical protein